RSTARNGWYSRKLSIRAERKKRQEDSAARLVNILYRENKNRCGRREIEARGPSPTRLAKSRVLIDGACREKAGADAGVGPQCRRFRALGQQSRRTRKRIRRRGRCCRRRTSPLRIALSPHIADSCAAEQSASEPTSLVRHDKKGRSPLLGAALSSAAGVS